MRLRAAVVALTTVAATVGLAGCGRTTEVVVGGAAADSRAAASAPAAPEVLDLAAAMQATAALSSMTFVFDVTGGWFPMTGQGAVDVNARIGSIDVEGAGLATTVVVDGGTAYLLVPAAFSDGVEDRWLSHSIEDGSAGFGATLPGLDRLERTGTAFVRVGPDVRDGLALTQWRLARAADDGDDADRADASGGIGGEAAWVVDELRSWAHADDVRLWTAADGSVRAVRATSEHRTFDVHVTSVGEPVVVTVPDASLVRPFS